MADIRHTATPAVILTPKGDRELDTEGGRVLDRTTPARGVYLSRMPVPGVRNARRPRVAPSFELFQ